MAYACHPSIWEWRQEDQVFKVSLGYKSEFEPNLGYMRPCLNKYINRKKEKKAGCFFRAGGALRHRSTARRPCFSLPCLSPGASDSTSVIPSLKWDNSSSSQTVGVLKVHLLIRGGWSWSVPWGGGRAIWPLGSTPSCGSLFE